MHWAYFSKSCCNCVWLDAEPEPAPPPVAFVLGVALLDVVVATLATAADFEPPQPEASRPRLVSIAIPK